MVFSLYFTLKIKVHKSIVFLFINYNFKVDSEPWTCMNSFRLAKPRNPNEIG